MRYYIDGNNTKPAYIQLYEQIRTDIVDKVYAFNTKLPSKRFLAEETNVSLTTVEHAYAILCEEGYIETRERSGYFVIYKENDFMSMKQGGGERGVIEGQRTHVKNEFPFSVIAKTMRRVLSEYGDLILVKSPNNGLYLLRNAISSYLARSIGISAGPEQIIIGSGAEYLYSLIAQFIGSDNEFALEKPSYPKIRKVYEANGITCDLLRMGKEGIKTSELERTKATVLHVTPFNSFPSKITAGVSKRMEYINWANTRNGYIIEDNYESELTVSKKHVDTVFSMSRECKTIYINTFSETIAPSLRVGYMVLQEEMLEEFEKRVGFYSCTVPVFEQYVLAELLNSGDFERHINRTRRLRRKDNQISGGV